MAKAMKKSQKQTKQLKNIVDELDLGFEECQEDMYQDAIETPESGISIPKSNSPVFQISVMHNFDPALAPRVGDGIDESNDDLDRELEEYMRDNEVDDDQMLKKMKTQKPRRSYNKAPFRLKATVSRSGRVVKPKFFDDQSIKKKEKKKRRISNNHEQSLVESKKGRRDSGHLVNDDDEIQNNQLDEAIVVKNEPIDIAEDEEVHEVPYDPARDNHIFHSPEQHEMKIEVPELRRSRPGRIIKPKKLDGFVVGRVEERQAKSEGRKKAFILNGSTDIVPQEIKIERRGRPRKIIQLVSDQVIPKIEAPKSEIIRYNATKTIQKVVTNTNKKVESNKKVVVYNIIKNKTIPVQQPEPSVVPSPSSIPSCFVPVDIKSILSKPLNVPSIPMNLSHTSSTASLTVKKISSSTNNSHKKSDVPVKAQEEEEESDCEILVEEDPVHLDRERLRREKEISFLKARLKQLEALQALDDQRRAATDKSKTEIKKEMPKKPNEIAKKVNGSTKNTQKQK